MKPLLVGIRLGPNAPADTVPFSADRAGSGRRLASVLEVEDVRELFDTANWYPVAPDLRGRPFVVLAGRLAGEAYFGDCPPFFEWLEFEPIGVPVAVIPHPSGRNRWWNTFENRESARAFIYKALHEKGGKQ